MLYQCATHEDTWATVADALARPLAGIGGQGPVSASTTRLNSAPHAVLVNDWGTRVSFWGPRTQATSIPKLLPPCGGSKTPSNFERLPRCGVSERRMRPSATIWINVCELSSQMAIWTCVAAVHRCGERRAYCQRHVLTGSSTMKRQPGSNGPCILCVFPRCSTRPPEAFQSLRCIESETLTCGDTGVPPVAGKIVGGDRTLIGASVGSGQLSPRWKRPSVPTSPFSPHVPWLPPSFHGASPATLLHQLAIGEADRGAC
jgi:hypothetical protein